MQPFIQYTIASQKLLKSCLERIEYPLLSNQNYDFTKVSIPLTITGLYSGSHNFYQPHTVHTRRPAYFRMVLIPKAIHFPSWLSLALYVLWDCSHITQYS